MLEMVWNFISFTCNFVEKFFITVQLVLGLCLRIGEIIVYLSTTIFNKMYCFVSDIIHNIIIIQRDFEYFVNDLHNILQYISLGLQETGEYVLNVLLFLLRCPVNFAIALAGVVLNIKFSSQCLAAVIIKTFSDLVCVLKNSLILIGVSIWTAVVFLPECIIFSIKTLTKLIIKLFDELCLFLYYVFESVHLTTIEASRFIIDTPLEAVAGLSVGGAVIYIARRNQAVIKELLLHYLASLKTILSQVFIQMVIYISFLIERCLLYVRIGSHQIVAMFIEASINLTTKLRDLYRRCKDSHPNTRQQHNLKIGKDDGDRLCIVCQDREKDTVFFPCRHLCMCEDCSSNEAFRVNRVRFCPICRNRITRKYRVYV